MSRTTPTSSLDYDLPPERIAQEAIEPRDAARLLVVDGLRDLTFRQLPSLLDPGDLLVVNRTRVRAARLRGHKKDSGGAVEVLLLRRRSDDEWEALVKPARRIRIGTEVGFSQLDGVVTSDPEDGVVRLRLTAPAGSDVDDVLPHVGSVPLPPYFHGALADPERYQTVFAKTVGSAAAPTAALHFTPRLIDDLATAGVVFAEVELEVGVDTFRPIATETLESHLMHSERYTVPEAVAQQIAVTQTRGGRIVAVGTTVVRTLETAAAHGVVEPGSGHSELFIMPGYRFRAVDALITNFHAPRTSLIALVAAAIGPSWRGVYEHAVREEFRFLSFGDAMFIDLRRRDAP